jgi:16S rRNA (guanine966-N2)-methyltransferase
VASLLEARAAIEGSIVLDLYAGTGALAFEALSRGAARAVCVEANRRTAAALGRTAADLGLSARVTVVPLTLGARLQPSSGARLRAALGGNPADLVFADPPYADVDDVPPLLVALGAERLVAPGAWVVIEHATRHAPALPPHLLPVEGAYRYGDTSVLLARVHAAPPASVPPSP